MAGKGGARQGAGRPKGAVTQRSQAAIGEIIKAGKLPLEVMLAAMRKADAEGNEQEAVRLAGMAAPYCHPRLATQQAEIDFTGSLAAPHEKVPVGMLGWAELLGMMPEDALTDAERERLLAAEKKQA